MSTISIWSFTSLSYFKQLRYLKLYLAFPRTKLFREGALNQVSFGIVLTLHIL